MKAITITTELKQANQELLGNSTIGTIRIFNSIPRTFYSLTYNAGQRTDGYNTLGDIELDPDGNPGVLTNIHETDGFYDVVTPVIDEATQKLGALFFNTTDFTYPVVALTQPEIDARVEAIADSVAEDTENSKVSDGQEEAKFVFKNLRKLLNDGTLTQGQFDTAEDLLFDALIPLNWGRWGIAKTRLDAITDPVNQTLLDILNDIRTRIDNYILSN